MNEIIHNPATGDTMEFIQSGQDTDGKITEFIITIAPFSKWAKWPRHFHSFHTETFKVLEGELNLTHNDSKYLLKPGDEKVIVKNFDLHSFWNETDKYVKLQAEIIPSGTIEKGLRLSYKLAQEGKINKRNLPYNPFWILVLMEYFDAYFPVIPWKLQRLFFRLGARFANLFGYK